VNDVRASLFHARRWGKLELPGSLGRGSRSVVKPGARALSGGSRTSLASAAVTRCFRGSLVQIGSGLASHTIRVPQARLSDPGHRTRRAVKPLARSECVSSSAGEYAMAEDVGKRP
jgi:hypothetical protein